MEEDEYLASLEHLAGKIVVVTGYECNPAKAVTLSLWRLTNARLPSVGRLGSVFVL